MDHNMKNAYMLVYERQLKTPIKRVVVPNADSKAAVLECDNTAPTRAAIGQLYYDKEKKEHYTFVDFYGLEPRVPEKLHQEVWEDNTNFLFERQIYSTEFFVFVHNVLLESYSLIPVAGPELQPRLEASATRVAAKTIIGVLSHAYHNAVILPMTKRLVQLFSQSQAAAKEFLAYIMQDNTFEVMYILNKCPDKDARAAVKDLLVGVVLASLPQEGLEYTQFDVEKKGNFRVNKYKTNLGVLLHCLIRGVNNELAQNWMRFDQYFELLLAIAKGGDDHLKTYMNSRGLIPTLIDFYLGADSPLCEKGERRPTMGNKFRNPTFFPLIDLVCVLAVNGDMSFVQPQDLKTRALFGLPTQILYLLDKDARECLTSRGFLAKTIIEGHSTPDFANLMAFLSFESEAFSRKIIKLLLRGINADLTRDLRPQLEIVKRMLRTADSLQRKRIEWLLGIPAVCKALPQAIASGEKPYEQIKFGLPLLKSIHDSVHEYSSTLMYKSSHDSLLTLLWNHCKTLEIQPVVCLLELMHDIPAVSDYVLALPAPNYQYLKYTDWLRPFLQSYKAEAKGLSVFAAFFEQKKGEDVQKEAEELLADLDKKEALPGNSKQQPYIIGRPTGENVVIKETKGYVELVVSEIVTEVHESKPTGKDNLAVPEEYFEVASSEGKKPDEVKKVAIKVASVESTVLKFEARNSKLSQCEHDDVDRMKSVKVRMNIVDKSGANFYVPSATFVCAIEPHKYSPTLIPLGGPSFTWQSSGCWARTGAASR